MRDIENLKSCPFLKRINLLSYKAGPDWVVNTINCLYTFSKLDKEIKLYKAKCSVRMKMLYKYNVSYHSWYLCACSWNVSVYFMMSSYNVRLLYKPSLWKGTILSFFFVILIWIRCCLYIYDSRYKTFNYYI